MDGSNSTTIWEAETKDNFGNITQYNLGNGLQTNKTYDNNTGMLTQINTGTSSSQTSIQNLQYQYDDLYNITQRKDVLSNQQDLFTYDNLNRLTDIQTYKDADDPTTSITKHMTYDNVGDITHKDDVGDMTYGGLGTVNSGPTGSNPYSITEIDNNPNTITTPQNILYTSFNKVRKITTSDVDGNNAKELDFVYGPDYGRRKTVYSLNSLPVTTRYYAFGNYEETVDASNVSTKDYFIYGGDGVAAIYRITGTTTPGTMYYIHKDNLGSFDKVTNSSGAVVDSYSFDAWGNRRSTTDWTASETTTTTNNHLFSRGFTGHEHLDEFGLINMNGRCYDPLLGRILSPDPELQDPANIQNYNRYSYCLNNPLKYTDPSGYYIYGKTYQVDPVYSIPHFSDLDLPGGCRYDIAEYLDEMQNKLEMEQMELNSMFGLVGGLGGGGGDSGYSNKPGSSAENADDCKPEDKIPPHVDGFVDPFDILTGNDVLIPKTIERTEKDFIDLNFLTITPYVEQTIQEGNCPWVITNNQFKTEISHSFDIIPGVLNTGLGRDGVPIFTLFDMFTGGYSLNGNAHFELGLPWTSSDKKIGLSIEIHTQDLMNRWGDLIHNAIQNTNPYIFAPTNPYNYGWEWRIVF